MISKDHILIVPSNEALNIKFELWGFKMRLDIGSEWARNVSRRPPANDYILISQSALPVMTTLAVEEYTQHVTASLCTSS